MNEELIETFLREMKENHQDEVDSVMLPEGTEEYVRSRVGEGDTETLLFMLRVGYLMGLQTGFQAGQSGEELATVITVPGPLQA